MIIIYFTESKQIIATIAKNPTITEVDGKWYNGDEIISNSIIDLSYKYIEEQDLERDECLQFLHTADYYSVASPTIEQRMSAAEDLLAAIMEGTI